jgi:hypothetical protein
MKILRLTRLARRVAVAAAVPTLALLAATAARSDDASDDGGRAPLVLRDEGSFFVGGTRTLIQYSAGPAINRPGHIMKDAMYVQFKIPLARHDPPKPNVVLWSGGCHVGTEFQTTPDGREGWEHMFVRAG